MLATIKKKLGRRLTKGQKRRLHNIVCKNSFSGFFIGLFFGRNLTNLAQIYNTDKWGTHFYTPHYQRHFSKFKYKPIRLLEIGVGGYDDPEIGGESLRMWKRYFPFGRIYALDIYDKSLQEESRIKIFRGSQVDKAFLKHVLNEIKYPLDIIIDDGSHINEHVVNTFIHLFPQLKNGGIYVIEDTQTSYWRSYGGDNENLNNPKTIMNFFKQIPDNLNYKEFHIKDYQPKYIESHISSISFYHNIIFITKGINA